MFGLGLVWSVVFCVAALAAAFGIAMFSARLEGRRIVRNRPYVLDPSHASVLVVNIDHPDGYRIVGVVGVTPRSEGVSVSVIVVPKASAKVKTLHKASR